VEIEMEIQTVVAKGVFNAPAYSQAVKVTGAQALVFLAGQVALDEQGEPAHRGDFKAQAHSVLDAVKRLVEASGSSIDRIVKLTVFLTDARYRPEFGPIRDAFFGGKVPPLAVIEVGALMRPEWLIEIEAIAVV
jgi:enamine deaminase RidA (YjgF/YER057c/UK114 family)